MDFDTANRKMPRHGRNGPQEPGPITGPSIFAGPC